MDLSVVTVSYNSRDLLRDCLDSVISTLPSWIEYELFVVDNASADDSVSMVRDRYPQVRLFDNSDNRGFAAGSNQAIIESRGRYVMLLNPDTVVRDGALDGMVRLMDGDSEIAVVGPKLLFPDGSFQHSAFSFPSLAMIFLDFFPLHHRLSNSRLNGRYPRRLYELGEPFPIDHPLGAALMARRKIIDQVGLLDEGFFMYCEEIDWCMRIKDAGWRIVCWPKAEIVHYVGRSTAQLPDEMYVALHKSRHRLYEKHYGSGFRRAAHLLVTLGMLSRDVRDRWAAMRGLLPRDSLERRRTAYRRIRSMSW